MRLFFTMLVIGWGMILYGSWLPEVSDAAVSELGSLSGKPMMSGFVFIGGRYLPPPYTVSRRGNGIFINRIQVEQPLAWTVGSGKVASNEALGGDFEVVTPETPAVVPAPVTAPAMVSSIDDLFNNTAAQVPPPQNQDEASSIDDLFTNLDAAPARKQPVSGVEGQSSSTGGAGIPTAQLNNVESVRQQIEQKRRGYELALTAGEVYFFSQDKRLNGTYGSARTMLEVLPTALRSAKSPNELLRLLQQGGVYFLDITTCTELYRHRNTFPLLKERLESIKQSEEWEAQRRNDLRRR